MPVPRVVATAATTTKSGNTQRGKEENQMNERSTLVLDEFFRPFNLNV